MSRAAAQDVRGLAQEKFISEVLHNLIVQTNNDDVSKRGIFEAGFCNRFQFFFFVSILRKAANLVLLYAAALPLMWQNMSHYKLCQCAFAASIFYMCTLKVYILVSKGFKGCVRFTTKLSVPALEEIIFPRKRQR